MEEYYTIQGEGFNTGTAAYFIRLGGCDVGCHWCDVKDSWDAEKHPVKTVQEIADNVVHASANVAVVTGGEPLMYDLDLLCQALREKQCKTFLETSGAYPLTGKWDWICVSPKKFKAPLKENLALAQELKVVIYHTSDLAWAEQHAGFVSKECKLFLQPEWSRSAEVLPLIVEYVKHNPQWKISLQTHKFMNIP